MQEGEARFQTEDQSENAQNPDLKSKRVAQAAFLKRRIQHDKIYTKDLEVNPYEMGRYMPRIPGAMGIDVVHPSRHFYRNPTYSPHLTTLLIF